MNNNTTENPDLETTSAIFKSELKRLKDELDILWETSPEETRPVLNDMQKLISIHEEFHSLKKTLGPLARLVEGITNDKDHIVKCILCLEKSLDEWNEEKPDTISESLLTFLETNCPESPVTKALSFQEDKALKALLDCARTISSLNSSTVSRGSHMSGDDSEYVLFEKENANEISFKDVFRT